MLSLLYGPTLTSVHDYQTYMYIHLFLVYVTTESISFHRKSSCICALDVSRALCFNRSLPGCNDPFLKKFQTHCAFAFLHFLPNGHEFMGPWPIPTLISISLKFCFQHNFLPYWRFPPLHFLEEFLQNHSFSRAPLVENVKTKRKPATEYKFTKTCWIVSYCR